MDAKTDGEITLAADQPPEPGELPEIAPGLFWARIPLPMRLNHVNVWFVRDGEGWQVVDTGLDAPMCRDAWETLLAGPLGGLPIRRIVLTHGHPDHVGLAGWLSDRFDCGFAATRTEWLFAQWRHHIRGRPFGPRIKRFLAAHGCDEAAIAQFAGTDAAIEKSTHAVPEQIERLRHGQNVPLGGQTFRVIVGGGHADEHASFYRAEQHVLIAGDQILQRITPMIGVFGYELGTDPLSEYLASLDRFESLPRDTLVLPSHGLPFMGLHARLAQLRRHHEERLVELLAAMEAPRTAFALASVIFERAMQENQGRFALAETLAHLHYAETLGKARRATGADGRILFARA